MHFREIEKTDNKISSIISKSTELYVCSICNINESTYICSHCNQLFCNECLENNDNHKIVNIKEMENKTEKKKSIFLNSIEKIIKTILLK